MLLIMMSCNLLCSVLSVWDHESKTWFARFRWTKATNSYVHCRRLVVCVIGRSVYAATLSDVTDTKLCSASLSWEKLDSFCELSLLSSVERSQNRPHVELTSLFILVCQLTLQSSQSLHQDCCNLFVIERETVLWFKWELQQICTQRSVYPSWGDVIRLMSDGALSQLRTLQLKDKLLTRREAD